MARDVDHIVPKAKGGADQLDNLQALCAPCHAHKTATDAGARWRETVGADGWPALQACYRGPGADGGADAGPGGQSDQPAGGRQ